jgi:formamidopyrimidine-DNA glycosylase
MPELPEVETVKRGLQQALENHIIKSVELRRAGLRAPFPENFASSLIGQGIKILRRRAKYILIDLSGGDTWLVHLGMSGSFRLMPATQKFTPETHDHVVVTLKSGLRVVYNDPRRFGVMDVYSTSTETTHKILSKIGPEPLEDDFTGAVLLARLKNKKTPIKTTLLDQNILAGIGNIYACEALFMAGIHPQTIASTLKPKAMDALVKAIKTVMNAALKSGGSTLRDHKQLDGNTGYFQHEFAVYGHEGEPCKGCTCKDKSAVQAIIQSGRTTFYCPIKQKE